MSCSATAFADAPYFTESSYSFTVYLDQQSYYAGTVQAYDPEGDDFVYLLHDESGLFSMMLYHGYILADLDNLVPGTYSMTVEAIDIYSESSFVDVEIEVLAASPPEIVSYHFYPMGGGMWWITGTVASATPTGVVKFGGLLNGRSAPYNSTGQFTLVTSIYGFGPVAMQAFDSNGQASDVVYYMIGY